MPKHEFMLCRDVPEYVGIENYDRRKMVVIDDDFILGNRIHMIDIEMHHNDLGNLKLGLNYYGVTILDCKMAEELKNNLPGYCEDSPDLQKLIAVLEEAITQEKYIIHFGI